MTEEDLDPTDIDISLQPTLPSLELPDYHGRTPVAMKTSVAGAGTRVTRSHSIGDRIVFVGEARVRKAGHEETDDGLVYVETLKVVDLFEIGAEPGRRLLSAVRTSYRTNDDEREGRQALPDIDLVGATDASGVVLTDAELREIRGDPVRAMLSPDMTPVVVVYSDGLRELWPAEFGPEEPRPLVGETMDEGDEDLPRIYVEKLLNPETGETVAEWTREQEEFRLLGIEQQLEAEEAEGLDVVDVVGDTADALLGEQSYEEGLEPLADGGFGDDVVDEDAAAGVEFPPEPTVDDYWFVDREISELKDQLGNVARLDKARRILEAEKRGRGRGLKARKGAVDLIMARIAEIEKGEVT